MQFLPCFFPPAGKIRGSRNRQRRRNGGNRWALFSCVFGGKLHPAALRSWVRPSIGFGGRAATPRHHRGSGRRVVGGPVGADREPRGGPDGRSAARPPRRLAVASRRSGSEHGAT